MVAHGTEVCRRSTPRRPDARPPTSGSIVRGPAFALVADCRSHTVRGADAGTSPRRRLDRRCRRARRPHRLVVSPGRPRRPCSGPSRPSRSWPRLANGCDPLRGPQPACRSSTAPAGAGGPGRLALLETSTFPARRRGSVKSDQVTLGCSRHAAVIRPARRAARTQRAEHVVQADTGGRAVRPRSAERDRDHSPCDRHFRRTLIEVRKKRFVSRT